MKRVLCLLSCVLSLVLHAAVGDVSLQWDNSPTNQMIIAYHIYGSTNITAPLSSWPRLLTVPATFTGATNTMATVRIVPGQFFFVVTSSNLWGESLFSNVASTPPLPTPLLTTIKGAN